MAKPWTVNIHYDGKLDACVPADAASVLEVGCGDAFWRLACRDAYRATSLWTSTSRFLERAKQRFPGAQVTWTHGDILVVGERLGSFDAVVSNATLHHLPDTRVALRCMRELVRPGGTLAIVAFARPGWPPCAMELATLVNRGVAIRIRGKWEHSAPTVWPPRDTVVQLRRHVRAELPGARMALLPLGRVFILWQAM